MATRTIAIPVAEVIDGGTKQEFYADVRKTLDLAVRMANTSATACLRQDDLELEKCSKLYTYPALANLSSGVTFAAATIARSVEKAYRQNRWQVKTARRSSQSFRSQPWPLLCNKSTNTLQLEACEEFITARIRLLGGWWTVRLAGGSSYRDQIRGMRIAIANNAVCDSKLWVDRKHKAILGIACDIPAATSSERSGTMVVASSRDSLLVATFARSDVPFVINADVCKRWQSEAGRRHQRLRQDRKSGANRRKIRDEMNAISEKQQRRMKTLCHEVTARIVEKASRMNVAEIQLDLTIKSYAASFPWFDLVEKLKYKCDDAGIAVVDITQMVSEPDIAKPHVYFKFAPLAQRVKIGMTGREDGGRHGSETDSSEELTILAIDNQPKTKLSAREKHFHAMFQEHRVNGEWFHSEPVIAWLREAQWIGNAGNHSQIAQVLDVSKDASLLASSMPTVSVLNHAIESECSQNADNKRGYAESNQPALAVTNRLECD